MRIAVIILGIASIATMVGQFMTMSLELPYLAYIAVLATMVLWLIGVAFVYGVPLVAVITFALSGMAGIAFGLYFGLHSSFLSVPVSVVLTLLSVGGYLEKKREDRRAAESREHLALLARGHLSQQPASRLAARLGIVETVNT